VTITPAAAGRRERNKQQKLERIVQAASELFSAHGVDDVTTQQIADQADIGAGTLFLYAKNKGELLLLVQNSHYEEALQKGTAAAAHARGCVASVMAIVGPIVECNRVHVGNGQTYLREIAFGDPNETQHAHALDIVARTEAAIAEALASRGAFEPARAAVAATIVSAIMFLALARSEPQRRDEEVTALIEQQVAVLLDGARE
jgi:AcrR family transcriptional regulator